mmetsp:Transcript_26272/g.51585  ORF Transcript_26272/g.51585 Transcript_26272/m.51585 type:complete len:108 (-) Transcript_26272:75-398(-)
MIGRQPTSQKSRSDRFETWAKAQTFALAPQGWLIPLLFSSDIGGKFKAAEALSVSVNVTRGMRYKNTHSITCLSVCQLSVCLSVAMSGSLIPRTIFLSIQRPSLSHV